MISHAISKSGLITLTLSLLVAISARAETVRFETTSPHSDIKLMNQRLGSA